MTDGGREHRADPTEQRAAEGQARPDADELMPKMRRTNGPPKQVLRNREEQAARDQLDRARWEKAIEARIAAHRMALGFLEETHQ